MWAAAGSVDTHLSFLSFLSFLKVYRTDVAHGRMSPRRAIEPLNVVKDIGTGLFLGRNRKNHPTLRASSLSSSSPLLGVHARVHPRARRKAESNHRHFEGIESRNSVAPDEVPCASPALVLLIAHPVHHWSAMAVHLTKPFYRTQR